MNFDRFRRKRSRHYKKNAVWAVLIASVVIGGLFFYSLLKDLPRPERITERAVAESTKIYDRTGKILLYEVHGEEKRTVIPLAEVPPEIRWATVVAEDDTFFRHYGLDWKGIARAFFKNLRRANYVQGGSTITQQLVKNSILTGDRTITRKLKEAILAVLIERRYSKDEILELYLNQIPYGAGAYGIEAAARTYFSKSAKDISLAEAATLAALPKAPTYYSPYGSHRQELVARRDWIIDRLEKEGLVNKDAAGRAKKERLFFVPPKQSILAPHFVFYVKEYLAEKYGEEMVERGGLRVITTLDWRLQEEAEKIVREGAEYNEKLVKAYNAALVAVDPRTGDILTMVGSRDYWSPPLPKKCSPGISCKFDPQVNVALRPRQPGSAFKPFVYAAAFKRGYTPETVLFDVPTEFNPLCTPEGRPGPLLKDEKDCYHPQDYDGKFRGPVTLRQALAQSLNVPSVKLLYLAGIKNSIETARGLGLSTLTEEDRYGLSLVLGGAEVTLLELTSAFGVFAQEGILHPASAILRVEGPKGNILEEKKDSSLPALDTEIARTINDLLSDNDARVPVFNPRSSLYFPGRSVAAKTGTTQDFRDAWVVGYTPSVVVGVWVGNNDNTPMQTGGLSVMVAGPLWHKFLEAAASSVPPEDFTKPSYLKPEKPILRGLYRSGGIVQIDKNSKKRATSLTPGDSIEEISFGAISSLLTKIRKEDPGGDPPSSPWEDPQSSNWDAGIQNWLAQNPLPDPQIPAAYDDVHLPEKRPRVLLSYPPPGVVRLTALDTVTASVHGFFPVREVSFFIDDVLTEAKLPPFTADEMSFGLEKSLPPGIHKIKIAAYDAVGNKESAEREITITEK